VIQLEDFHEFDLRVGEIVQAERLEGTRRILKLVVSLGDDQRQVISDLAHFYEPEELLGKQVILLANLMPSILHGQRSQGKILTIHGAGEVNTFATADRISNLGAKVL